MVDSQLSFDVIPQTQPRNRCVQMIMRRTEKIDSTKYRFLLQMLDTGNKVAVEAQSAKSESLVLLRTTVV